MFLETSLKPIYGVSIHWSSDCNMACKYCYIDKDKPAMASLNRDIRQSLEDGSFINNIKLKLDSIKNQVDSLALWGAEPTINGKYFAQFIDELLDFFPNAKSLMFSTNALLGAEVLYNQFLEPLMKKVEQIQRPFRFDLQLSLDGPEAINDASRHIGATKNTLNTLYYLIEMMPQTHDYLTLELSTKPTLDISFMKEMVDGGLEKFYEYFSFGEEVQKKAYTLIGDKTCVRARVSVTPTLVDPGFYTKEDGKIFASWLKMLMHVNQNNWTHRQGPLFFQPLGGIENILFSPNILAEGYNSLSCSAGKNNITIDYKGTIYTCNRLCRNDALTDEHKYKIPMISNSTIDDPTDQKWLKRTWATQAFHRNFLSRFQFANLIIIPMAAAGQIDNKYFRDENARLLLFAATISLYCHVGAEEDYTSNIFIPPTSYFRLLGNGALEELMRYHKYEENRGVENVWPSNVL